MWPEHFRITLVSAHGREVASAQGPVSVAEHLAGEADRFDILIIPGGMGTRTEIANTHLIGWLGELAAKAEAIASFCTGAALLAATGLLDGRRATTNKRAFDWVAAQRPAVRWQRRARWVEDGRFTTSSGVSAGIDMALALIARLHGRDAASEAATWAEYRWFETADDDPFAAI